MLDRVRAALRGLWRAVHKARFRQRWRHPRRPTVTRIVSGGVCIIAGFMIATGAINARGTDLRPGRNTDLIGLVQSEKYHNEQLVQQVAAARAEVDALTAQRNKLPNADARMNQARTAAGLSSVAGPSVTVTLTDAPVDVAPPGIDGDLLVVHQQDIQAVANAMWAGGAEAMTIQGIRVISTTAIKCVGNTVVLHGVPYAPPYVITAIGDPKRMQDSLDANPYVRGYRVYAERYAMGYDLTTAARTLMPGHQGAVELQYARQSGASAAPSDQPT